MRHWFTRSPGALRPLAARTAGKGLAPSRRTHRAALGFVVLLAGWLMACADAERAALPGPPPAPGSPARVIAIAPAIVETLYVLGLEDRVVGVGDFAAWPPEVAEKPRIGGLFDPRLETIAGLEPDLAILLVSERGLEEPLARLGVEVMLLEVESVAEVAEAIAAIGERMGVEARAEAFLAGWWSGLEPDSLGADEERPRILLSIVRDAGRLSAVLTANRETFYQELLDNLGAENVFAEAPVLYPQVAAEEIVARRPSVVIELQPRPLDAPAADRLLADWETVPFATTPCTRVVGGAHTLLPGPRLPELYRDLRAAVADCLDEVPGT